MSTPRFGRITCWLARDVIVCPGKPTSADVEIKPQRRARLYPRFCAARTAPDATARRAKGNCALALANPVYLAIASDDSVLRHAAGGVHGTLMPPFAKTPGGAC